MDVEADVEYGDGTSEWLIEAMQWSPRDSWRAEYDSWHAFRRSWTSRADDEA